MVAIVTFKEANIIAIISILISMLSVASKSFVFSIATALTMKQLFFNWLSGITDFFGIFFAVSWVFYKPNDDYLQDAFSTIQDVWLYRLYCCTLPLVGSVSIFFFIIVLYENWSSGTGGTRMSSYAKCCARFFLILGVTIIWICGCIAGMLASEIMTWVFPAVTLFILGTQRFPETSEAGEFYFTIIGWINSAKKHRVGTRYKGCTSYTKQQDKIMRLSSFHHVILIDGEENTDGSWNYSLFKDKKCREYLDKEIETQYMNVTMEGFRINSSNKDVSQFWPSFWNFYGDIWNDGFSDIKREWNNFSFGKKCFQAFAAVVVGFSTFVMGPIYLLSRIWTLFYPIWIVLYLYFGYNVNVWNTNHIALFQVVMITIYLSQCGILWILFILNMREQYIMHHMLPSRRYLNGSIKAERADKLLKEITNHYFGIIVVPIRRAIVIEHFGPDLGPIILSYLPAKDEYDNKENITKVRTV